MRKTMINFISGVMFIFFLAVCQAQADVLPILRDEGLPNAEDDIFVWSGDDAARATNFLDQEAPEGVKYLRTSNGSPYKGWGVFFCGANACEKDLSRFRNGNGNLEFSVRVDGQLKIEIEAPKGSKSSVVINGPATAAALHAVSSAP